jgi:hypothetical protein
MAGQHRSARRESAGSTVPEAAYIVSASLTVYGGFSA